MATASARGRCTLCCTAWNVKAISNLLSANLADGHESSIEQPEGAEWEPGDVDSMRFELAEEVEKLLQPENAKQQKKK
jgi:hypothetical protein